MKKIYSLLGCVLFGFITHDVHALCDEGKEASCVASNGLTGEKVCVGGRWSSCITLGVPQPPKGVLHPNFMVLKVAYAPPGNAWGEEPSSVEYETKNSCGSKISSSRTFKSGTEVTAGLKAGAMKGELGIGIETSKTDSKSLELTKTESLKLESFGSSAKDGIDHDKDVIYVLLNVAVPVEGKTSNNLAWYLDLSDAVLQWVFVSELKHPETMRAGVRTQLQSWGVTTADYATILAEDPLAYGASPSSDPARFRATDQQLPYEPPIEGVRSPVVSYELSSESVASSGTAYEHSTSVHASVEEEAEFLGLGASLKVEQEFTWTRTFEKEVTDGNETLASLKLTGPTPKYAGRTAMKVYFDVVYNSFVFEPIVGPMVFHGSVYNASGDLAVNQPVTVTLGGKTYTTFTDSKGQYSLYDDEPEPKTPRVIIGTPTLKPVKQLDLFIK